MNSMDPAVKDLLQALTSGAFLLERQTGRIVAINAMAEKWTGLSRAELEGKPLGAVFSLPGKTDCPLFSGTGEKFPQTHLALTPSEIEGPRKLKLKYSPLPSGEILCLADPFEEDVSLSQAHNDFVSVVSHEFRTPLTSIKGYADTILRYGENLPAEQQRRFIAIIKDQADRLTRMVENLLTVSKLGAGRSQVSYRPVPLKKLVEKVVQNVRAKDQPDRQFDVNIPNHIPEVWADADKLEQVLLNLVDNAVKYSTPGSQVTVVSRMHETEPDLLQIQVQDTGVGIAPEHLPTLFNRFSRIDNPLTRNVEGTGLGLNITQSLTQAMGGTLAVESTPGQGSTFTLTFPAATAERQADYRRKLTSDSPFPLEDPSA